MRRRMSNGRAFTPDQPKHGDTILHCGHLGQSTTHHPAHWFKFDGPLGFQRPDGSRGEAEWFAACEPCFIKHGETVANHVCGDSVWMGDEPAIMKVEN